MKHYVFRHEESINVQGEWQTVHSLGFYLVEVGETKSRKLLGTAEVTFHIKYPLKLDNGIVIQEEDYYRKYSED